MLIGPPQRSCDSPPSANRACEITATLAWPSPHVLWRSYLACCNRGPLPGGLRSRSLRVGAALQRRWSAAPQRSWRTFTRIAGLNRRPLKHSQQAVEAPLMRFCPLQRSLAHAALSGGATSRTIPLRRSPPMRFSAHEHEGQASALSSGRISPTYVGRAPDPHLVTWNRPSSNPTEWVVLTAPKWHGLVGTRLRPDGVPGVPPFAALFRALGRCVFPRRSTHLPFSHTRPPRGFVRGNCRRVRWRV